MKRKRDAEEQIIGFLKAHEQGAKLPDLVREYGDSPSRVSIAGDPSAAAWRFPRPST